MDLLNYIKISAHFIKTIPLACAPDVHKSINLSKEEKRRYENEVCFVGTMALNREKTLSRLSDFDLGIWGFWLEKIPELKKYYRKQHVYGEEAARIYNASKIVLDMPSTYHLTDYAPRGKTSYVTPRVFEVPACEAFLLTAENSFLSNLYEVGKEIICYKDEAELKEMIKYYLSHSEERKLIARRGQERPGEARRGPIGTIPTRKGLKKCFQL